MPPPGMDTATGAVASAAAPSSPRVSSRSPRSSTRTLIGWPGCSARVWVEERSLLSTGARSFSGEAGIDTASALLRQAVLGRRMVGQERRQVEDPSSRRHLPQPSFLALRNRKSSWRPKAWFDPHKSRRIDPARQCAAPNLIAMGKVGKQNHSNRWWAVALLARGDLACQIVALIWRQILTSRFCMPFGARDFRDSDTLFWVLG